MLRATCRVTVVQMIVQIPCFFLVSFKWGTGGTLISKTAYSLAPDKISFKAGRKIMMIINMLDVVLEAWHTFLERRVGGWEGESCYVWGRNCQTSCKKTNKCNSYVRSKWENYVSPKRRRRSKWRERTNPNCHLFHSTISLSIHKKLIN